MPLPHGAKVSLMLAARAIPDTPISLAHTRVLRAAPSNTPGTLQAREIASLPPAAHAFTPGKLQGGTCPLHILHPNPPNSPILAHSTSWHPEVWS